MKRRRWGWLEAGSGTGNCIKMKYIFVEKSVQCDINWIKNSLLTFLSLSMTTCLNRSEVDCCTVVVQ